MKDRSGQRLGNYRFLRLLGEGSSAEVYLGEHVYLKTFVAIKILHTYKSREESKGFLREARTIARLQNPNIIHVLDFGVDDSPFFVMDYLAKGTLRQRHPQGNILPLTTIVSYVKQIATALQYAHTAKVIHRDVKPENVLVGNNNEIILSDFGIAVDAHSTFSLKTMDTSGTPYYMAPELIAGKPRPASDQYALGVVVYEWLCGAKPFDGNHLSLMYQHTWSPVPPLREKVSTIPADVEQVVIRALAKDPQQRFMDILTFARALEQASLPQRAPTTALPLKRAPSREEVLVKAYRAVQDGTILEPEVIRSIAKRFEVIARDPRAYKSISFDAVRAAQILYARAQQIERHLKEFP